METKILIITAASIGFFHTILGPDHYLPFIAMSKARNWSMFKTGLITFLCGIGHVGSSVLLGLLGVYLGAQVTKLEALESVRGDIAGWLLLGFGLAYFLWGLKKALKNEKHVHLHSHENVTHFHSHSHEIEHAHAHGEYKANITPWILFTIFVFGPCEPLIPVLMYPAAQNSITGLVAVTLVFSAVTISTMLALVFVSLWGINLIPVSKLERYSHALAGFAIFACGFSVQFLGL